MKIEQTPATPVEQPDQLAWFRDRLDFHPDPYQAQILLSSSNLGILNCSRQWGKTVTMAAKAVQHAYCAPERMVVVVSPAERQSREFMRRVRAHVRKLGLPLESDGDNKISLVFPNGSRIVGLPGRPDTIRCFSAVTLVLIDEASRVSEEMYEAVGPMLATTDGAMWLLSTPNGRRGFFYRAWTGGGPEWERVTVKATDCPRIRPAHLERERLKLSDRVFRQEYLCEFAATEDGVFDPDLVEAAISYEFEPLAI